MACRTRKVFHIIYGSVKEPLESWLLKGEQTNTSVAYGDRLKLKLFRRLEEEAQELEAALEDELE